MYVFRGLTSNEEKSIIALFRNGQAINEVKAEDSHFDTEDKDVVPSPAAPSPYSASFPEFSRLTVLNYEFVSGTLQSRQSTRHYRKPQVSCGQTKIAIANVGSGPSWIRRIMSSSCCSLAPKYRLCFCVICWRIVRASPLLKEQWRALASLASRHRFFESIPH